MPRLLFTSGKDIIHCTGGWVGPMAGLDRFGKSLPPLGFDHQSVQPLGSRYTEYAARPTDCNTSHINNLISRQRLVSTRTLLLTFYLLIFYKYEGHDKGDAINESNTLFFVF